MKTFLYTKIRKVKSPLFGTAYSSGIDFYIPEDLKFSDLYSDNMSEFHDSVKKISIKPGESILIPSGLKVVLPSNYGLLFVNKSGICVKFGATIGACLIDQDYRGELIFHLYNYTNEEKTFETGTKIVQGILIERPLVVMGEISNKEYQQYEKTERGSGGFGSTGL